MKQTIETFLKRLEIEHGAVVEEILDTIRTCKTEKIVGLEDRMASLFCRAISELPQDHIDEDKGNQIVDAFENIKSMANLKRNTSELKTFFFLAEIYNRIPVDDEISDFESLLDNLEKIRIIFKIKDVQGNSVFPIETKIFGIINCDNLMTDIIKVKSVQALMLALQIFDKNQYPKELSQIEEIVHSKGLRFVEYLFNGAIRLGGEDWKINYEANGALVLYDFTSGKLLVRNSKSEYFDANIVDEDCYAFAELKAEKNDLQEEIAFYVEYSIKEHKRIDLRKELTCNNNSANIFKILSLIFDQKYYNVIMQDSLVKVEDKILPLNPFSINDKNCICDGKANINARRAVAEWLHRYPLVEVSGIGLNYVNLGTLLLLIDIFEVPLRELGLQSSDLKLDELLMHWIDLSENKQKAFNEYLQRVDELLKYVKDDKSFFEKRYVNEFLLPYQISEEILLRLGFDDMVYDNPIYECDIKYDFFNDKQVGEILGEPQIDISEYTFEDLDGESQGIIEGKFKVIINQEEKKVFYGTDIYYFRSLVDKVKLLNSRLLPWTVVNKVQDIPLNKVIDMMECFRVAFQKKHLETPLASVAKYRIANHILLLKLDEQLIDRWFTLMLKHEIVDYSVIENKTGIYNAADVLYVAKDRSRSQSTLKYINDKYIFDPLVRSDVDIFDQKITRDTEGYKINGKLIQSIYFLFDLIQNGKATKDTITYYMSTTAAEDDRHMSFLCGGKRVRLIDIIKTNGCKVKIHTIYSGREGRKNVQDYWNASYSGIDGEVIEPLVELNTKVSKADIDLIDIMYKGILKGKIFEGDYLVVREFNQPAHNVMSDELQDLEKITALFCRRKDREQR